MIFQHFSHCPSIYLQLQDVPNCCIFAFFTAKSPDVLHKGNAICDNMIGNGYLNGSDMFTNCVDISSSTFSIRNRAQTNDNELAGKYDLFPVQQLSVLPQPKWASSVFS